MGLGVDSRVAQTVKNLPAIQETWVQSLGQEDLLEKGIATHSSILPGEFLGQRNLAGQSPWGHKELDTTEQLTHTSSSHSSSHRPLSLKYFCVFYKFIDKSFLVLFF